MPVRSRKLIARHPSDRGRRLQTVVAPGDDYCFRSRTWGRIRRMPKKQNEGPSTSADMQELREEVSSLREIVRVLIDIAEGIREELQWLTRNGLPAGEAGMSFLPVVRRMARDPAAANWNDRLVMDRSAGAADGDADREPDTPCSEVVFESGDTVEFEWEGEWVVAEVVSVNVADSTAEVMLIPSQEGMIVSLDELEKVDLTTLDEDEPVVTPTPPQNPPEQRRQGNLF